MDLGLKGKKVIMNGGAHGLGLASLKLFAAEGADVAFFSRKEDKIAAAKQAIDAAGPGKVFAEVFDMASGGDAYKAWLEKAASELGGCDIFIHTASASGTGGTGDWQACLDMDIMGAALGVEALTPHLEKSDSGSIVMMSSTAALETFIAPNPFNALKAALITYASQLSQAMAPKGAKIEQAPLGETLRSLLANKVFLGLAFGWAVQIMIGYAMAFWLAPAMIRLFGVSVGDVALYLGLAFLIGGIPGPIMGGFVTDWLARHDERWRAWLPGIVSLGAILPLWIAFEAGSFALFLGLFALAYGVYVASQAPIMSGIQSAVEPSQRGMAVAFALFFNNLIGQAFGLGVIGWLSDTLEPARGNAALGDAVLYVSLAAGIAALAIFAWTARQMRLTGYLEKIANS